MDDRISFDKASTVFRIDVTGLSAAEAEAVAGRALIQAARALGERCDLRRFRRPAKLEMCGDNGSSLLVVTDSRGRRATARLEIVGLTDEIADEIEARGVHGFYARNDR